MPKHDYFIFLLEKRLHSITKVRIVANTEKALVTQHYAISGNFQGGVFAC